MRSPRIAVNCLFQFATDKLFFDFRRYRRDGELAILARQRNLGLTSFFVES